MTTEPKFKTYLFFRAEGFYPVQITKDSVAANIECNPGTLKVEEYNYKGRCKVIWTQVDGWLDAEYAALFGGPTMTTEAVPAVLTDEQIKHICTTTSDRELLAVVPFVRGIEQAVLQSPEIQAWKKDAQRYRWLREHPLDGLEETTPCIRAADDDPGHWALNGEAADAAIDTAMQEQKP